ncbi:MAG: DUF1456 family protein [Bacteroidetes bacterium]|nr:DUF1456 family protein [Bacteroidota bacterium]
MNNNDILRSIRYIFDLSDSEMIELFALAEQTVSRMQVCDWLKKEDDHAFKGIVDRDLANFLNGFIMDKRGKKEGAQPIPEKKLNNNIVFRKLKIALHLKDTDILSMLDSVGMRISKHELSAFFRKPTQSQYRPCKDQILRNFLNAMKIKYQDS